MANVLYISYTGLADPLGQSQVLQYLIGLAREHRITLITFEKPANLKQPDKIRQLEAQCIAAGIDWHRLTYHRRPGIPATVYDIVRGTFKAVRLAWRTKADIVHARSYIAGIMALAVKRAAGARYIFDMRGFWPDERVDGGIWKKDSMHYRFFKRVERRLFRDADHVVSLTRAGVREIRGFKYLAGRMPEISVIPTCTNLETFRVVNRPDDNTFTLGYVGSAGSWYLFDEVARAVRLLFEIDAHARFLVVNQNEHDHIRQRLSNAGVDLERVEIRAAGFAEVATQVARMTAGIFFIKPVFSKKASCPTRMGEFLACGKPCLANSGVGDVEEDLRDTATGITVDRFSDDVMTDALKRLIHLSAENDIAAKCRRAAEERFSLEGGTRTYAGIYARLSAAQSEAADRAADELPRP